MVKKYQDSKYGQLQKKEEERKSSRARERSRKHWVLDSVSNSFWFLCRTRSVSLTWSSATAANFAWSLQGANRDSSSSQVIQAHEPFPRKIKEGTLIAVIDDIELPITQELQIYQVREGTWTSVGLTFFNEGTQYCAITRKVSMGWRSGCSDSSQTR